MTAVAIRCLLVITCLFASNTSAQYYLNNYGPPPPQQQQLPSNSPYGLNSDVVDKKYVNSGQAIMLICDLPNNMPDGKVSHSLEFFICFFFFLIFSLREALFCVFEYIVFLFIYFTVYYTI